MPYKIRKIRNSDLYKVFNTETGEVHSKGSTKKDAKAQVRLLYSKAKDEMVGGSETFLERRLREEIEGMSDLTPDQRQQLLSIALSLISLPANPLQVKGLFNFNTADKSKGQSVSSILKEAKAKLFGGKISISNLKGLLNKSYEKKPKDYMDFEVDKELSGERVQVYKNPKTGQVVVSHRGTQGIHDIGNDLKYALGFDLKNTERFKHAQDIQRKAEAKYGAENITTIGHSLGSKIARDVGQNTKEVIQLNPAYNIPDALKKTSDKTHTIRTQYDPVSFLQPLLKSGDKNVTTIESKTSNPLAEHTVDVLERANPDVEIGKGFSKMSIKDLKSHAKMLPKEHRIALTKIKKKDLVEHLNKVGGARMCNQVVDT
jgi:hypothetical protein